MKKSVIVVFLIFIIVFSASCVIQPIGSSNLLYPYLFPSEGTTVNKTGDIFMVTDLENNSFGSVLLQIWTGEPSTHIANISNSGVGKQSGEYVHANETGEYIIRLKANSNLRDEYVNLKVYLIEGETYLYSFNVKSISEKTVNVQDFTFFVK